ncbi:MAG: Crp/Fnr family transcriptional regulator [Limosilactobacillus mucosae]
MSIEKIYAAINSEPAVHKVMANAPLKIIERMRVVEFEIGEFNLRQGESYDETYLLVAGRVKVYLDSANGKSVVLDVYRSGMFLGEQEAVINKPYSASIINITPVRLLKIDNRDFVAWLNNDQQFANRMISYLSEQVYHLTKRTERYSLYSAMQQIGLELTRSAKEKRPISREQLTYEVDTSYRNINRVLK